MNYIASANRYLYQQMIDAKMMIKQKHYQMAITITSQTKKSSLSSSSSSHLMGKTIKIFQDQHSLISHQIIYAGREMWGTVLLIGMCNHIPNNAFMMYRILNGHTALLTWILLIIQIIYIMVTLLFLAAYTNVLHQARKYLPSVQLLIGNSEQNENGNKNNEFFNAKWSCLNMYELLNSSKKIGIPIGPSNTITFRIVFEVIFIFFKFYLSFLSFLFLYIYFFNN